MSTRAPKTRAFTLIELLVVLVVVGALFAICVPVYGRVAETGRAAKCVANLRQLGAAMGLYLGEHNMTMPTMLAGRTDLSQQGITSTPRLTPTRRETPRSSPARPTKARPPGRAPATIGTWR